MSALTDPIADFLTRIRNASRSGKHELTAPFSKIKADIARILKQEGYISAYEVETSGDKPQIKVVTKFVNRNPAITGLKRVSKPG
jgi:small subunit ribosomal protein S8